VKDSCSLTLMVALILCLSAGLVLLPCESTAETIDVTIKGVDDGVKSTKQQDYKEAVLFAKRQAIERAGVEIKALTSVNNLIVQEDYIESKSEGILLPGYQIIDIGYAEDGTYQIVLVGKLRVKDKVSEGTTKKDLLGWDKTRWGMKSNEICRIYNLDCAKGVKSDHGTTTFVLKKRIRGSPLKERRGCGTLFTVHKDGGLIKVLRIVQIQTNAYDDFGKFLKDNTSLEKLFERTERSFIVKYGKPIQEKNEEDTFLFIERKERVWGLPSTLITLEYQFDKHGTANVTWEYVPTI